MSVPVQGAARPCKLSLPRQRGDAVVRPQVSVGTESLVRDRSRRLAVEHGIDFAFPFCDPHLDGFLAFGKVFQP